MTPAISGGQLHTIALKTDGTVWAWGEDTYGQLGGFTTTETCIRATLPYNCSTTPVQVLGESGAGNLENISKISTNPYGEHNLALDSNSNVWAWGDNSQGQLGNGSTGGTSSTPVKVLNVSGSGPLTDVVDIAAGENWSLAVKSDGTVWAWGSDVFGNLGNDAIDGTSNCNLPVQVKVGDNSNNTLGNLLNITTVAAGRQHSLALKDDGTIWTWGGVNANRMDPDPSRGYWAGFQAMEATDYAGYLFNNSTVIAGGLRHSLVIHDGAVEGWGDNSRHSRDVEGITPAIAVEATEYASFVLKDDGTVGDGKGSVWTTGIDTGNGGLGCGGHITSYHQHSTTPIQVVGEGGSGYLTDVIAIDTGEFHGVAVKDSGDSTYSYWTWGYNVSGMLGNGTTTNSWSPVQITLP